MTALTRFGNACNRATDASLYYARNGVAGALNLAGSGAQLVSFLGFSTLGYMQLTNTTTRNLDDGAIKLLIQDFEKKGAFFGFVDPKLAALAGAVALFGAGTLAKKIGSRMKANAIPDEDIKRVQAYTQQLGYANQAVGALNTNVNALNGHVNTLIQRLTTLTNTHGAARGAIPQLLGALEQLAQRVQQLTGAVTAK